MHPGSYTTGTEGEGLRLIARGLAVLLAQRHATCRTMVTAGTTAGQGTNLWYTASTTSPANIIDPSWHGSPRVGVCLDTCHLLLPPVTTSLFRARVRRHVPSARSGTVGLGSRSRVPPEPDSKNPCGYPQGSRQARAHWQRVPRTRAIPAGCSTIPRFSGLPMLLKRRNSTPPRAGAPQRRGSLPWDARNLRTLRKLMRTAPPSIVG